MHFKVQKMNGDYYFKSVDDNGPTDRVMGYCRFFDGGSIIDVYVKHSLSGQYFHYTDEPEYDPEKISDPKYLLGMLTIVGKHIAKYFLKVTVELDNDN